MRYALCSMLLCAMLLCEVLNIYCFTFDDDLTGNPVRSPSHDPANNKAIIKINRNASVISRILFKIDDIAAFRHDAWFLPHISYCLIIWVGRAVGQNTRKQHKIHLIQKQVLRCVIFTNQLAPNCLSQFFIDCFVELPSSAGAFPP